MDKGFYNQCILFGTCEMRLLNKILDLCLIFDCFSSRFDKVVFNLKLKNFYITLAASSKVSQES